MVKTSSTYLSQVLIVNDTGNSGPKALFSKYSIYMLATTGEHGEPIAAPCNCRTFPERKIHSYLEQP